MMLLSKIIFKTLFIFQKIKKYLKRNRYIKLKNLIKILLVSTKQDELQNILNNKKILTIKKCSY